jgi:SAM-dependent methyltransferase
MNDPFWEQSEQVEKFAAREPDRRLVGLLGEYTDPGATRVLDIGCAGGRNTELLASRGFDVHAVDTSTAMVERTRERIAWIVGEDEARKRVYVASMDDVAGFADASIHLVVALGVYHSAYSRDQWNRALSETRRVLSAGGRVLVSNFSPRTDLTGDGVTEVDKEPGVFVGLPSGRHVLLKADDLDAEMERHGLVPVVPTSTVVVDRERGQRVTVNGFYRRI